MHLLKTKTQIATFIALLFHISGFIAIALFKSQLFVSLTPLNLLVSFCLLLWTQQKINKGFIFFIINAYVIGFASEWIGINTGKLFGHYVYGQVLGPKWQGVPLLIGINWAITLLCIGVSMHMLHRRFVIRQPVKTSVFGKSWLNLSLIIDGAGIAVFFDWIIEPVAIKLAFWKWLSPDIPALNYWSWFGVSIILLVVFRLLQFEKSNLFAVHLLLIQLMFFLLLKTFL